MTTLDLGVLVSGGGTNLQAILDAVQDGTLDARVRVVVSNVAGVRALERAENAGVPTTVLSHRDYASRERYDQALVDELRGRGVEWVMLAGFMRVLSPVLLRAYAGHVINVHPALLPSFPGVHAQRQALEHGVKIAGCTVHFVDEGVDTGPIIGQRAVPVLPDDDESSLTARILKQEHALLVSVLRALSRGEVVVEPACDGRRARVTARLE